MHGVLDVEYSLNAHHTGHRQQVDILVEIGEPEFDVFDLYVINIAHG